MTLTETPIPLMPDLVIADGRPRNTIGALLITYTILGVPYYSYCSYYNIAVIAIIAIIVIIV